MIEQDPLLKEYKKYYPEEIRLISEMVKPLIGGTFGEIEIKVTIKPMGYRINNKESFECKLIGNPAQISVSEICTPNSND